MKAGTGVLSAESGRQVEKARATSLGAESSKVVHCYCKEIYLWSFKE
jgi:hypothetical protein